MMFPRGSRRNKLTRVSGYSLRRKTVAGIPSSSALGAARKPPGLIKSKTTSVPELV
jgi:hypothetical protein